LLEGRLDLRENAGVVVLAFVWGAQRQAGFNTEGTELTERVSA